MPDGSTILSILNGALSNAPSSAGSPQAAPAAAPSPGDQRLQILQLGAAGKLPAPTAAGDGIARVPIGAGDATPRPPIGTGDTDPGYNHGDMSGASGDRDPGFLDRFGNFGQGTKEGVALGLGAPVDLTTGVLNFGLRGLKLPTIDHPYLGSENIMDMIRATGLPDIQPRDEFDTYLQAGGRGVGAGLATVTMGGLASPRVASVIARPFVERPLSTTSAFTTSNAASGVGGQAGHEVAQAIAPNEPFVDSLLSTTGGLIGGFAPGAAAGAVKAPFRAYGLLSEPTTQAFQEASAGKVLKDASTYGVPIDLPEPALPGMPTSIGRAGNDSGLLALENTLDRASPGAQGDALDSASQANQTLRRGLLDVESGGAGAPAVAGAPQAQNLPAFAGNASRVWKYEPSTPGLDLPNIYTTVAPFGVGEGGGSMFTGAGKGHVVSSWKVEPDGTVTGRSVLAEDGNMYPVNKLGEVGLKPKVFATEEEAARAAEATQPGAPVKGGTHQTANRAPVRGDPGEIAPAVQQIERQAQRGADQSATTALARVQNALERAGVGQGLDRDTAPLVARQELDASLKAARKTESDMWNGIDPEGSLAFPTAPLKSEIDSYVAGVPKVDQMDLPQDLIDRIKGLGDHEPLGEWTAIPKQLGVKQREAQSAGQWNRARMIGDLKGIVNGRLNALDESDFAPLDSSGGKVPASATGPVKPKSQTLLQFLSSRGGVRDTGGDLAAQDLNKWHLDKPFRRKLVNPMGQDLDYAREAAVEAGYLPEGSTTNDLLDAMNREARGNAVYPHGDTVIPGFDPDQYAAERQSWQDAGSRDYAAAAVERYRQAKSYSANFNQLFSRGPVKQTLKRSDGGAPAVPPSQSLVGITRTPEGIDQFLQATKQSPEAIGAVRDYLLRDLEAKAIGPGGQLKADALRKWVGANGAKLDRIDPTLREHLADAATQQDALEQVLAQNKLRTEALENTAAHEFLGAEPQKAIGRILRADQPAVYSRQLMKSLANKPAAQAGVRRALLDWILDKASTRGADLKGDQLLNSGALDDVVRDNRSAIFEILTPPQQTMLAKVQEAARVQARLGRATLSGSPTYALLAGDRYLDLMIGKAAGRVARIAGKGASALGGGVGSMLGGPAGGAVGAAIGEGVGGDMIKGLYSKSRQQITDLVRRGIDEPEFGRQLMMKATPGNAKMAGPRFRAYLLTSPVLGEQRSKSGQKAPSLQ